MTFNTDHIHLFHPESGESLLGRRNGDTSAAPAAPSVSAGGATESQAPQ
jgi:hypothetical protein